jgi:hypothetical protein
MAGKNDIRPTLNPERSLHGCVIGLVCQDHLVRDLFDQAYAKHRGGNPEDHIAACELLREVRLRELAARRVRPTGNGEQVVDAAVRRSVRIPHEPRLAYRPVQRDE